MTMMFKEFSETSLHSIYECTICKEKEYLSLQALRSLSLSERIPNQVLGDAALAQGLLTHDCLAPIL